MNKMLILAACIVAVRHATTSRARAEARPRLGSRRSRGADRRRGPGERAKSDTKTVLDVALGSPDHTTLVAAVKAADLVEVLASPGGVYTVFAPTNAAFDKLPKGTRRGAPEAREEGGPAQAAAAPRRHPRHRDQGHEGRRHASRWPTAARSPSTSRTARSRSTGANILASIPAANGIVHVVDAVMLPVAR